MATGSGTSGTFWTGKGSLGTDAIKPEMNTITGGKGAGTTETRSGSQGSSGNRIDTSSNRSK